MRILRLLVLYLAFAQLSPPSALAGDAISISDKALLQASMQKYIDSKLIDGVYLHIAKKTGKIQELYPVTAHPMTLEVGKYFVLCSDFRDKSGKSVNMDFYMARKGDSFVVFKTVIDDRRQLQSFRAATKAARIR